MTSRTHDAIAFASLVTAAVYFPPQSVNVLTLAVAVIGCDIGALVPDLDQAGNRLWDLLPGGNSVGKVLRRVFYKHRTFTHSILGTFLIYRGLGWLLPKLLNGTAIDVSLVFGAIMIGYLSHLAADFTTKEGLPLLYPFKINFGFPPFEWLRLTTDSFMERWVVFPAVLIYLVSFIILHQSQVLGIIRLVQ